jgi:capsular polysaccharide biosynthesis protein
MKRHEPELAQYAVFVRRQAMLLTVCTLVGMAAAAWWLVRTPPTYTATAAVLLAPVPGFVDTDPDGRAPRAVTVDTDAQLLRSARVVGAVARAAGQDPATVADSFHVSAPSLTRVLRISFTASEPGAARLAAETAAAELIAARREYLPALHPDQIAKLQVQVADQERQLERLVAAGDQPQRRRQLEDGLATLRSRLANLYMAHARPGRVLQAPALPTRPDAGDPEVPITSGAMLGLLTGCALAAARERRQRPRVVNSSSTSRPNSIAAGGAAG